jgi:hypothetical protein
MEYGDLCESVVNLLDFNEKLSFAFCVDCLCSFLFVQDLVLILLRQRFGRLILVCALRP